MTAAYSAIVIGAGPTGLACGIELKRRGIDTLIIDKGCLTNSLYHYPTHMTFFTTPELLEIGDKGGGVHLDRIAFGEEQLLRAVTRQVLAQPREGDPQILPLVSGRRVRP